MIEMKPTESVLPPGVKPLSQYAHGIPSSSRTSDRRIGRGRVHSQLESPTSGRKKLDTSTNKMGEREQLVLDNNQLGPSGQFAQLLRSKQAEKMVTWGLDEPAIMSDHA